MLKWSALVAVVLVTIAFLYRISSLGAGEPARHPSLDRAEVPAAVKLLKSARDASDWDTAESEVEKAVSTLGKEHFASEMLRQSLKESRSDMERLRKSIDQTIESLTFRPWMESDLPEGFPAFTPVHYIEVKKLPEYRMARATMPASQQRGQNSAFWKLFGHIKRNDIEMTAPVRMDYSSSEVDAKVASMSFLYGSLETGTPGNDAVDNSVEVLNIPQQNVVSIGIRGRMTPESIERGHQSLLAWLDEHQTEYRSSGPLRRMGYNSPFIPADRAFFELQIPIERTTALTESSSNDVTE